ncbi:Hamartin protein-domain-containing protein [Syncephalis fuscata]|nr:Hamartin protein-domain-containing protein [Syncephalis fuscata]
MDVDMISKQWWYNTLLGALREENGFEPVREVTNVLLQLLSPSPLTAEEDKLSLISRESLIMALLHVYRGNCTITNQVEQAGTRELKDNLEDILVAYGGANAKAFFMAVHKYFIHSSDRAHMLDLLITHARRQDLHLHHIVDTPLMEALLCSLLLDKSALVVTSGVSLLLMLMPRICTALTKMLPLLYWVCMRVLYWRPPPMGDETSSPSGENLGLRIVSVMADEWDTAIDDDADVRVPEAAPLFNMLYGMFPCNTITFLRSPIAYTKEVDCCFGKVIAKDEDELIRSEAMPLLRRHQLHPNFVLFTNALEERQDASRWMDKEPADIVAECIRLQSDKASMDEDVSYHGEQVMLVRNQMLSENDQVPVLDVEAGEEESLTERWIPNEAVHTPIRQEELLLDKESIDKTTSKPDVAPLSTDLVVNLDESAMSRDQSLSAIYPAGISVAASVRSILAAHRALTSGTLIGTEHWDANMFEPVATSDAVSIDTKSTETSTEQFIKTVNVLQRKVLLLTNRLNYELFLKQQYTRHIGRLHRDRLMDSAVEAERQGLYNTCRALKNEIRLTKEAYERQRAEATTAKANHVNWQNELNNKLRMYRDERKRMLVDTMELRDSLDRSMATIRNQETLLQERYSRIVGMEHEVKGQEALAMKAGEYEQQIDQLSKELMLWREDTAKGEEQRKEAEHLQELWKHAEMRADALEHELDIARTHAIDNALQVNDLKNEKEQLILDLARSRKSCQHQVQLWQDAQVNLKKRLKHAEDVYRAARHVNSEQERRLLTALAQLEKSQRIVNTFGSSKSPPTVASTSSSPPTPTTVSLPSVRSPLTMQSRSLSNERSPSTTATTTTAVASTKQEVTTPKRRQYNSSNNKVAITMAVAIMGRLYYYYSSSS